MGAGNMLGVGHVDNVHDRTNDVLHSRAGLGQRVGYSRQREPEPQPQQSDQPSKTPRYPVRSLEEPHALIDAAQGGGKTSAPVGFKDFWRY